MHTYLQFFQLCLDSVHVIDKGVEVGHLNIQVVEALLEAHELTVKLRPPGAEGSNLGLMWSHTAKRGSIKQVINMSSESLCTFASTVISLNRDYFHYAVPLQNFTYPTSSSSES